MYISTSVTCCPHSLKSSLISDLIMSPDRPNLWLILSDTSALISAHPLHFMALSILFIFPSSFAAVAFSLISLPNNPLQHLSIFSAADDQIQAFGASPPSPLLYALISLIFTTCAAAAISSSTFNAFHAKPVELAAALKSALVSFLPLLATTLSVWIVTLLIVFSYLGFLFTNHRLIGLEKYSLPIDIAVAVLFMALLIYLQTEWSLASAVVAGVWVICFFKYVKIEYGSSYGWNCWLVLKIAAFVVFSSVLSLYSTAALTVFFIYCKASRHELQFEIDAANGKLGHDYVPLSHDVIVF